MSTASRTSQTGEPPVRAAPALQRTLLLITWQVPVLERFPRSQRFLLGDRLQALALDLVEVLVDAQYRKQPRAELQHANLVLEKMRLLWRVAYNLRHVDAKGYEHSAREIDEIGRRIGAWLKRAAAVAPVSRPPARDLFDAMAGFAPLLTAARRAARGKAMRPDVAAYGFHLERETLHLSDELYAGTWNPGGYRRLVVQEPKTRHISVAPFRDRVVHQALDGVLGPLARRSFIADSFASIPGRGQHRAIARYEQFRDQHRFVLRCDIHRFFPSIDHEVVKADARRFVACPRTLRVLDAVIDGSNAQEPVDAYFPGDDLFSPFERRRGLPLGNLTSQWLGNLVLNPMDHWIKEVLRVRGYLRYLDDFALFCESAEEGAALAQRIRSFLDRRRLRLHARKTRVLDCREPTTFLGLELHACGRRALPPANLSRAARRVAQLRADYRAGRADEDTVRGALQGWIAHARHADTWLLRRRWFRRGWFCPEGEPPRPRPGPYIARAQAPEAAAERP